MTGNDLRAVAEKCVDEEAVYTYTFFRVTEAAAATPIQCESKP